MSTGIVNPENRSRQTDRVLRIMSLTNPDALLDIRLRAEITHALTPKPLHGLVGAGSRGKKSLTKIQKLRKQRGESWFSK